MKNSQIREWSKNTLPAEVSDYLLAHLPTFESSSNYPYSVTRVRAMRMKLFPRDAYPRFLNMSLDEITLKIGESEYKQDIDALSREYSGVNLIEHALNRNMAESFQKILRITEGELHDLIAEYLRIFDIRDIKTILRGKAHDIAEAQILESLVTGGMLRYTLLSGLVSKSVDEIITALRDSLYAPILKKYDGTNLQDIENELDKFYYENLFGAIGFAGSEDRKQFDQFVRREVDIQNLSLLLRVKKYDSGGSGDCSIENVSSMLIPDGLYLNPAQLQKLCYDDFVKALRLTPYWAAIGSLLENQDLASVSLTEIDSRLLKFNLKRATVNSRMFLMSIIPILEFIIYKSNEVRNLRIIIRGKSSGMDTNIIKERLVIL